MLGAKAIIGMIGKETIATTIKKEAPGFLAQVVAAVAIASGAQPGERVGVMFFTADGEHGPTPMARTVRLSEMLEPDGEVGTIDVRATLEAIPDQAIIDMIPV